MVDFANAWEVFQALTELERNLTYFSCLSAVVIGWEASKRWL